MGPCGRVERPETCGPIPVLSTAHLSGPEARTGANDWPVAAWENPDYGFFCYVADAEDPGEDWPGLAAAIRWAARHGYQWVRFDADGTIDFDDPELGTYDW